MAYIKTNWVDGQTKLNAENLNKIEEGISTNDTAITSLTDKVTSLDEQVQTIEHSVNLNEVDITDLKNRIKALEDELHASKE